MINTRIPGRYAKSLLDLAIEKNQLEKVYEDMEWLQAVTRASREFTNMLKSPIINADTKNKVLDAVTKGRVGELTKAFSRLLINKGRENFLPEIITSFIRQYKKHKDIHTVKLTTAVPASDELKRSIVNHVKKTMDLKNIELQTEVDANIIGGFVLQTGDRLVDASVAYDLKAIARQFENNDFIYKVR